MTASAADPQELAAGNRPHLKAASYSFRAELFYRWRRSPVGMVGTFMVLSVLLLALTAAPILLQWTRPSITGASASLHRPGWKGASPSIFSARTNSVVTS